MFGRKFLPNILTNAMLGVLVLTLAIPVQAASPVANFSMNVTSGYAPLTVQFTDLSTNTPETWWWEFNVPISTFTSSEQNPVYEFSDPGVYSVYLVASNGDGYDAESKPAAITVLESPSVTAPVASFSTDIATGTVPLTVQFTDLSLGNITDWTWDFDGDSVADSTDQNPSHTYVQGGNYTVTLQVTSDSGTDLETKNNYIYAGPLTAKYLKANFQYSPSAGAAPLQVQFTDTTRANGLYSRNWDFGDGTTSNEANPLHVYGTAGEYDVRLRVQSDQTTSSENYAKIIKAYPGASGSPLPTNTYGAKMTQMMESNWNLTVIGSLLPTSYTDIMPAPLFWGLLFGGVFLILFVRQGTSWLVALLGIIIGGNVLLFLPPEWQALGQVMLILSIGAFLYVLIMGRIRSN